MRGHIVHSAPTDTPVLLGRGRWVLLAADGSVRDVEARWATAVIALVEGHRGNQHVGVA